MQILVSKIIDGNVAVSTDDGNLVYQELNKAIENGKTVELDFNEIEIMTTAFLNAAIGQLYSIYNSDKLNASLKLVNVAEDDKILFKLVVDRAKEYFADKKSFEDSVNEVLGDD